MEKLVYTKEELENIIRKAVKGERIHVMNFFLNRIKEILLPYKEQFNYLNEEGYMQNEQWFDLNGRIQAFKEVENEMKIFIGILSNKD